MTSSTRNFARAALFPALFLVGCLKQETPPGPVSHAPLVVDEAMQQRQWATATVRYQNGETTAWPTGFVLEHNPAAPRWAPVVTDGPLFLANIIAMPIGYVFTPGWTRVTYANDPVEPTYNAMPVLEKK